MLFIVLNFLPLILFLWIPAIHVKMLLILVFALTGWGLKVIPQAITSLTIIVLIPLLGLGSFSESLAGFSEPFVWLLVSAFVFAGGMEKTGVGTRVAYTLLYYARGKTRLILMYVLLTIVSIGFFIPTAAGRSATLMPICKGVIDLIKDKKQTILYGKSIMIGVAFSSSFVGWGLMTGSNSSVYAVSAIESLLGYKWSYSFWFLCNFPIMIIVVFCFWIILNKLFLQQINPVLGDTAFIQRERIALGKMKQAEWRMILLGLFTLLGWVTESIHGLSVPYIALLGSIVSCLPKIGVQSWDEVEKRISWDTIILFGAGVAVANAMHRNGTASWIALKITNFIPEIDALGAAIFIMVIVLILRIGFAEMLAITATVLPITINLAQTWEINPIWLVQLMIIACSFGYFLPFQATSNLITYSYGYFKEKDLFVTGAVLTPIIMIIAITSALYYWPLVGLAP